MSATTAQLQAVGVSPRDTRRLMDAGRLERVSRGVYLVPDGRGGEDSFQRARHRHLAAAVACAKATPGSYLVGSTACIAHGLPVLAVPGEVHLSRRPRLWTRRPEVVGHRAWPHADPEMVEALGAQVQPAAAAVIETAALEGVVAGLIPADALLARREVDLGPIVQQWGARRGAAASRVVADHADGRRESPLETQVAWQAYVAGFQLRPQEVVRDRAGEWVARVDFVVDGTNVVVEVDGIGKYRGHRDFRDERVRHNQIEELGWIVVRVCLDDLVYGRFIPRLRAAVARAETRTRAGMA